MWFQFGMFVSVASGLCFGHQADIGLTSRSLTANNQHIEHITFTLYNILPTALELATYIIRRPTEK